MVGGVVRMRVNDVQKMLGEEEEAAAATTAATAPSNERVLKDDELQVCLLTSPPWTHPRHVKFYNRVI
jgi:hypothetical protein